MSNLTTKELTALEDQLGIESNLVKKYRTFAQQCTDASLKTKCTQIADMHQQHFSRLMSYLNS